MNFTARDALRFVWPFIWQYWAIYSFWTDNFLYLLNTCIELLYAENGYLWTWQHIKEAYTNLTADWEWAISLLTKYPIRTVDKFFTWRMVPMPWVATACDCPPEPENPCTYTYAWWSCICCTSCCASCTNDCPLEFTQILPHNKLSAWEYQIPWWDLPWMWGLNWRIIRLKPSATLQWLWVTYYRWPNFIKSFDDLVPLPQSRVATVLPLLMASMINIDRSAYFQWMYSKKISDLKNEDNVFPKTMVFDPNYPFYGSSIPTLIPH